MKTRKGATFIHLNIRSLLGKFDLFSHDFLDGTFDIIGLSETWLKPGFPDSLVSKDGYNLIRKDRDCTNKINKLKQGGGLCLFVKTGISIETIDLIENESLKCDIEWVCVKVGIGGNKKQVILLVYRPPCGRVSNAIDALRNMIEIIGEKFANCEKLVMGDFNINYANES